MENCIFCKIVSGEVPAYKVLESDSILAFLDIYPANKGQVLVIPKRHVTAQFSKVDSEVMAGTVSVAQEVAQKIEDSLENVSRCIIAIEGFDVPHFHIKIYPTYEPDPVKDAFGRWGPRADDNELKKIQDKITR